MCGQVLAHRTQALVAVVRVKLHPVRAEALVLGGGAGREVDAHVRAAQLGLVAAQGLGPLHEAAGVDLDSAVQCSIGSTTGCTITEKAPTRAFSWLKAPTRAFTFKTLLRHYAKRALTPRSLNMKLGPRHKSQKGRAGWLA